MVRFTSGAREAYRSLLRPPCDAGAGAAPPAVTDVAADCGRRKDRYATGFPLSRHARREKRRPRSEDWALEPRAGDATEDAALCTRLAATLSNLGRRDRTGKSKCGSLPVGVRRCVSSRVAGDGQRERTQSRYRKRPF